MERYESLPYFNNYLFIFKFNLDSYFLLQVVLVTHSLEELLSIAGKKFDINAKRLFIEKGGELDSLDLIKYVRFHMHLFHRSVVNVVLTRLLFYRDDDILYVSAGEPFIKREDAVNGKFRKQGRGRVSVNDWVTLNIGGKCFVTSRSTLVLKEPDSMLAK